MRRDGYSNQLSQHAPVSFNEELSWLLAAPLADDVWRRLELVGSDARYGQRLCTGRRGVNRKPSAQLQQLLDEIAADDDPLMVKVDLER